MAISPDGTTAVSGSFDTSAIRWSLTRNAAEQVLRFHESAVNAVAIAPDGRIVTGGEDGRIAIWQPGATDARARCCEGHTAPIVALAVSPDGATLASASWDRTVRLWPLDGGEPRVLEGHQQNVNGVAFTPDGKALVSAGYDLTVRIWPLDGSAPTIVTLPSPLNSVAVARDGEIVAGSADGRVFFLSPTGELRGEIAAAETPIIAIAVSGDGALVAAAGIRGSVAIIDRGARARSRARWSGPACRCGRRRSCPTTARCSPAAPTAWCGAGTRSPAITSAGRGGRRRRSARRLCRRPRREVYRACVACHTLTPDEGNRAGPTLHGIFGRRIATLPGYNFSPALKKIDIVWTPETVAKLFEVGPMAYTPGTKMPEQTIGSAEDRKALVEFLAKATK